jgi:hypothetical protein
LLVSRPRETPCKKFFALRRVFIPSLSSAIVFTSTNSPQLIVPRLIASTASLRFSRGSVNTTPTTTSLTICRTRDPLNPWTTKPSTSTRRMSSTTRPMLNPRHLIRIDGHRGILQAGCHQRVAATPVVYPGFGHDSGCRRNSVSDPSESLERQLRS